MVNKTVAELKELSKYKHRNRGSVTLVATRLAISRNHELIVPEWLAPTHKDKLPKGDRVAFPKPPKGPGTIFKIYYTLECNILGGLIFYCKTKRCRWKLIV